MISLSKSRPHTHHHPPFCYQSFRHRLLAMAELIIIFTDDSLQYPDTFHPSQNNINDSETAMGEFQFPIVAAASPCPSTSATCIPYSAINSPAPSSPSVSVTGSTKRGRGRPRKEIVSVFDESKYEHLDEAERKFRILRDKNNEASRRSRLRKTGQIKKAEKQIKRWERRNRKLEERLKYIQRLNQQLNDVVTGMLQK